jgi:hypothetical protein
MASSNGHAGTDAGAQAGPAPMGRPVRSLYFPPSRRHGRIAKVDVESSNLYPRPEMRNGHDRLDRKG